MKWVFWISAALMAYTYAGYVLWLRARAIWRSQPVRRGAYSGSVSVLMVVRNEERILEEKLRNLMALEYPGREPQIIVVSDGSTDGTERILRHWDTRIRAILNPVARGKAACLNDAMAVAEADLVVFTDVRQRIEPGAVQLLSENFVDPEVGCVSGELMLGDAATGESGDGLGLYWRIEKQVRELEARSGSVVGATGAIYAARRQLLTAVPEGTILDDVYIPMQIVRQGKRVVFDARARAWDVPNLGAGREFSRKVRTLSGNYQLLQLAPWLLSRSNPLRFEFVSHKVLRLCIPFALAALFIASLWLKAPIYRFALVLQLGFYGASLLGFGRLAKRGLLGRVADAAGAFVMLNGAAVVALANFVAGRRTAWTR